MLNIEKSSLILILIIVVLIAGFVSLITLGYTPGSVWHKAEDVKAGTFGNNVGKGNYNFPGNVGIKTLSPSSTLDVTGNIYATGQVTAGTTFHVGASDLSSSELKVNNNSLVVTTTGNVGVGTTNPQVKLDVAGEIKIGSRGEVQGTCNTYTPGAIRYNSTSKTFEGCDGLNWRPILTCGNPITFLYKGEVVTYGTVSHNGECWMDRNLGASRVATSYNDSQAYGDLFQWGRLDDGHQNRNSGTTTTLSSTSVPGHSNFIIASASPYYDWLSYQDDQLWQSNYWNWEENQSIRNNPCPPGWRVPTIDEWKTEQNSWWHPDTSGAFYSVLKLTAGGFRRGEVDVDVNWVGIHGLYWSTNTYGQNAKVMDVWNNNMSISDMYRSNGASIRCIKD